MTVPPLPDLVMYGRPGCGLCDEARAMVQALLAERESMGLAVPPFVERDIESDPDWVSAYFLSIPVLELGERRLDLVTSLARVRRLLTDVLDGDPAPVVR